MTAVATQVTFPSRGAAPGRPCRWSVNHTYTYEYIGPIITLFGGSFGSAEPHSPGHHAKADTVLRAPSFHVTKHPYLLVLALSLVVAGVASFLVLQRVQSIPVREVEVSNYQVAVAAKALPVGTHGHRRATSSSSPGPRRARWKAR